MMIHPSNRWEEEENKREVEGDDGRKMLRRTKEGGRGKDKNGGKEQRVGGREGKK